MESGTLNKRIYIETATASRNAYGENTPTYSTVAKVWANLRHLSGKQLELAQANVNTATASHVITIRYRSGLAIKSTRLRLGDTSTPSLAGITTDDLAAISLDDMATLPLDAPAVTTTPRYFYLNDISDPGERHQQLVITATEDTA